MTPPTSTAEAPEASGPTPAPAGRSRLVGELVFALLLTGLGAFVLLTTGDIYQPPSSTTVGPRVFPYVVGTALTLVGLLLVVALLRGHTGQPEESEDVDAGASTSWFTLAALAAVLIVHVNLIVPLGWPIAAAVLFAGCAIALGERRYVRTVLIALALGLGLHLLFGQLLSVSLPAGPLLAHVPGFAG